MSEIRHEPAGAASREGSRPKTRKRADDPVQYLKETRPKATSKSIAQDTRAVAYHLAIAARHAAVQTVARGKAYVPDRTLGTLVAERRQPSPYVLPLQDTPADLPKENLGSGLEATELEESEVEGGTKAQKSQAKILLQSAIPIVIVSILLGVAPDLYRPPWLLLTVPLVIASVFGSWLHVVRHLHQRRDLGD